MADQSEHDKLLEEAALLFLELSESPDDPDLLAERDRFLERSEAARAAYLKVQKGWSVSGGRPRSRLPVLIPALIGLGAGLYFASDPVQTYLLADISTGRDAVQTVLASGDAAYLDAGSALSDETDGNERRVELLRGGAFFDVSTNGQSFVVSTGAVDVTVRGTSFEVSRMADGVSVGVQEGLVDVTIDGATWSLSAGSQLFWQEGSGVTERVVEPENLATWRKDQLVVDDLSVRQVADILDRRIRGEIIVIGGTWGETRVSGTFDLADPKAALAALAVISGGRVLNGAPFASVLRPKN